jgi:NhaP-type Na+/H+ or K+/H+ antiporter
MIATMSAVTAGVQNTPRTARPTNQGGHWFRDLGRAVAIVAMVVVILSLNTTSYKLVTKPIGVWLEAFVGELVSHTIIGVAILMAAVWVRQRVPALGVRQYVAAAIAVIVATTLAVMVLYAISEGGMFDEPWPWSTRKITC